MEIIKLIPKSLKLNVKEEFEIYETQKTNPTVA